MKNIRPVTLIIILSALIIFSLTAPKTKYQGLNILKAINIPYNLYNWEGKDIGEFNTSDDRYNFISDVISRQYTSRYKETLLMLILDAGNFHNPKVCYSSSGYNVTEHPDTIIELQNKTLKTYTLEMKKENENTLLIYWLCINKQQIDWTGQKLKELWYSILGKKKAGLMIRLEIPVIRGNIAGAKNLTNRFLKDMLRNLTEEDAEYIFGK